MPQSEPDPVWKSLSGLHVGIGMTWGNVRFGFPLSGDVALLARQVSPTSLFASMVIVPVPGSPDRVAGPAERS